MPLLKTFLDKPCKACGVMFNRKQMPNGRLEDAAIFQRRKYCSLSCANSRQEVTHSALLWRARKHRKEACEACGFTKRLHVHHCDQNPANNDPSNLQTLCQHCHDFWHTTAKRLGRPVASRMPFLGLQPEALPALTDLKPLGTDKFPNAPQQHSECLPQSLEAEA